MRVQAASGEVARDARSEGCSPMKTSQVSRFQSYSSVVIFVSHSFRSTDLENRGTALSLA